jgi:hypothetical protein
MIATTTTAAFTVTRHACTITGAQNDRASNAQMGVREGDWSTEIGSEGDGGHTEELDKDGGYVEECLELARDGAPIKVAVDH